MTNGNFLSLQETVPGKWRARYRGNYGIYDIKVSLNEHGKAKDYSCSCPSGYFPCKHIAMTEEAIAGRKRKMQRESAHGIPSPEELLRHVTLNRLRNFVLRQSQCNENLRDAILMEFTFGAKKSGAGDEERNPYRAIMREALQNADFSGDDWRYDEYGGSIDGLDPWLDKARACVQEGKADEALAIAKACLEEFALWLEEQDAELADFLDEHYWKAPFEILESILDIPGCDAKALFDYCRKEMAKEVYQGGYFLSHFSDLLRILAERTGRGDEFIAVQDELLNEIGDKASHEAQVLLQCKIAFYRNTDQPGKAAEIVESNLQIEAFRKEAVERRIALGKYAEAKALIAEIWEKYQDYRRRPWDKLLLTIAQKENDIPAIRRIAGEFIAGRFDRDYYDIYKSAFSPEEWKTEVEKLLDRYRKDTRELRWETDSVAEVLAAEQKTERLLRHVGQHLSAEKIAHYHERFAKRFPAETLALFEKAIDKYAEENLGCSSYEYVAKLLQQMRKIEGGGAIVAKMLARYRTQYKRRRAMIETLNRL